MKYRYISDCHVHSDCSMDGTDPAMMLCENACRLGLYALTVTDHCECNIYWEDEFDRAVRQSFFETKKAAAVFRGRLNVYTGIELGQPLQNLEAVKDALGVCPFDFVLGSLHNLEGMEDFYFLDYKQLDINELMIGYFQQMLEMARWNQLDSLAHLTYPLRYIVGDKGIDLKIKDFYEKIDEILETLVKNQKALELNTSGLRQKIGKTLPSLSVLTRFRELGGKYVTIGSDAHRWADVGTGIETGLSLLQKAGFQHFTIYVKREPRLMPIE